MKKSFLVLALLLLCLPFYSIDYGAIISTTGYVENTIDQIEAEQFSQVNLWCLVPIGEKMKFSTEGFYSIDCNYAEANSESAVLQKANLALFMLDGNFKIGKNDAIGFSVGRFLMNDLSSTTLVQQIDGIDVRYRLGQTANFSVYSGYTGLLNANLVTMDTNLYVSEEIPFYTFSCPYLISGVKADFPVLFAAQNLACEFYSSIDLADNAYTKLYGAVRFDGPIYKSLYYVASSTFNFNVVDTTESEFSWGNISKLELNYYTGYKSCILNLNATYASNNFRPITVLDSTIDGMHFNSLLKVGALSTIKLLDPMLFLVSCDAIFNVGSIEVQNGYSGIQYNVFAYYQFFDDLLASFSIGQMFYADTEKVPFLEVKLNVKLSL